MPDIEERYNQLVARLRETALLGSCGHLLGWDEQTNLPKRGAGHRAEQVALLSGLVHEKSTAPELGDMLSDLRNPEDIGGEESPQAAVVREARRQYDRAVKLPRRLVEELSRTETLSQQAWIEARKAKDFAQFLPWLEKVVALKREEADAIGSETGVKYDALLDDYEPGATTEQVQSVFGPLRDALVELVSAIRDSDKQPDISILTRSYPVDVQRQFSISAARAIGFDFDAGRLDVAAHPFCSGIGPGDCRITTRYDEHHFPGAFFGTLHEAGHGIYEQGLPAEHFGTALGHSASLGIHESQSRMWENLVGRSRAFWEHFYKPAQSAFPEALSDVSINDFYAAVNDVRPSWIRVEADEVTYNLHIMLRFELEQAIVSGDLSPADLPGVWNETFQNYFGMTPPDDALGCLQDIHWSAGLIGYFPTYALGNLYAAQFFEQAEADLGDLPEMFRKGEFAPLKSWLNEKIHQRGLQYRADRLVEIVTGKPLSAAPLLNYLHNKIDPLYGL
ncbi:MAG: carboxypeptidase M32 [Planctomycetota bacterium]|nr:MAG: carboxypeptidase M32 [Planctomycetota bacterium]